MIKSLLTRCLVAAAMAVVALCASFPPSQAQAQASAVPNPFGSSFYADHRARRAGDMLTVLIEEASSATESAQTSTSKSDGVAAGLSTPARQQRQWQASLGDQFTGSGQVARSDQLLAQLSVVVDKIDADGNLWIHGEQDIELNGERQKIRLTGMVRADDIGPDNTVPSWRVSNAQIAMVGKGVLGDSQKQGWLSRVLSWLHLD